MNFPLKVLKTGLREQSGGAGEYRGGLGLEKVIEVLRGRVIVTFWGERFYSGAVGLFGGLPGTTARAFVLRKTGEKEEIPGRKVLILNEGDQIHIFSPGGAGYGDPLKRQPELVLRDVLDRKVSLRTAFEDYGVAIDEESMTIDSEKTGELRKERKKLRGPITWTYDRGPELGRE